MSEYAIGDIHGCFDEFQLLLKKIDFNPGKDTLYITGDIINRGSKSLEVIKYIMNYDNCINLVLGNHDIHFLAVALGYYKPKRKDTFDSILKYKKLNQIIGWLREKPLLITHRNFIFVHAGVLPNWTLEKAEKLSLEASEIINDNNKSPLLFSNLYNDYPKQYNDDLNIIDKVRVIINIMTRMRVLTINNELDFSYKSTIENIPNFLRPWFVDDNLLWDKMKIIFGHWSALGLFKNENVICLDSGCVWGNKLTAINLDDFNITQVDNLKFLFK